MDPPHRDRIAFVRVVSRPLREGDETPSTSRLAEEVRLANPSQFLAAERTAIEDAWPGDVIGLFDPGQYRIGDTLVRRASRFEFEGVPRFSPEHFAVVRAKDPLRRKQMEKGLEQLSEEGTHPDLPAAADGDAGPHRRAWWARCSSRCCSTGSSTSTARTSSWTGCPSATRAGWWGRASTRRRSTGSGNRQTVQDRDGLPLVLFRDDWALQHARGEAPRAQVPRRRAAAALERGEALRLEMLSVPQTALGPGVLSQLKNSTARSLEVVHRAGMMSTSWLVWRSFSTGLPAGIRAMVSSTFFRATASTKACVLAGSLTGVDGGLAPQA